MEKKEIRQIISNVEVREVGEDKQVHLCGYALKFDTWSQDLGGFTETLTRDCLNGTDMSDVVYTFNHDMDKPIARNTIGNGLGSLKLTVDDTGLYFDAVPTDTSYARDLVANMRAGVVNKCSFAFGLNYNNKESDTWDFSNKNCAKRTINKIDKLYDVSSVVNPAYLDTGCSVRNFEEHKEEYEAKELEERQKKEQNELELKLIEIELEL
jgi:HK97 family phage prohead protease